MLDGASRIDDVVRAAVADGQPAIGITDHGNMYGVLAMHAAARAAGISAVLGEEAYFTTGDRRDRPRRTDAEIFHFTLLAESDVGYHNLIKVSSGAYLDGFHYKPRVDFELLERHREGLIGTTGCLGSAVCQRLLEDDEIGAREIAGRFLDILGRDSFFVELQDHGLPDQHRVNRGLLRLASDLDLPLLATNDSHYTQREHAGVARGAPLRADRHDARRPEPPQVRGQRVLPEDGGRDAQRVLRPSRRVRQHAARRGAGRRRARVRECGAAGVPDSRRTRRGLVPPRAHAQRRDGAVRRAAAAARDRADRVRARRHQDDGVLGVLPRRLGPRPLRARARHPGRTGPGQRGRLVRRVLPPDRRHRPDPVRPAVRAVPEPGPQADARHRHGLRLPLPRRHDPVRGRTVRRRPRRADRHVLHDQGAGRGARRVTRPRLSVRHG